PAQPLAKKQAPVLKKPEATKKAAIQEDSDEEDEDEEDEEEDEQSLEDEEQTEPIMKTPAPKSNQKEIKSALKSGKGTD
ncbi:hypothetical protein ANCDUO_26431, partial [Ancylostoma duodenale]